MAIPTAIQDDTNIVTGVDAGTTTNVGHHAAHHVALASAVNAWVFVAAPTGVAATDTAAIQAAIDEAFTAGGGRVILKKGTYLVNATLVLKNRVWLEGQGMFSTTIRAANGLNAHVVKNYMSSNGVEANGLFTALRNVRVDGNKANQTAGNGLWWEPNPTWTAATNDDDFDSHHLCEHVYFENCFQDGIAGTGRSANVINNVHSYRSGRYGVLGQTDAFYNDIIIGASGQVGFWTQASNLWLNNIASFYSGQVTGANGHGFYFSNPAGTSGAVTGTNLHAQDNWATGFTFDTVQNINITASAADSNSRASSGTYAALDFWNAKGCQVQVLCFERSYDGSSGYQKNALRMRSGSTGNKVFITHTAIAPGTVSAAVTADSTTHGENELKINGQGGAVTAAYAATYTPDPYVATTHIMTLTGNLTLNAPANAHTGTKLELILVQDGTGGRTTTFNAAYNAQVAPSLAPTVPTRVEFTYTGTAWTQSFPSPDAPQVKRTLADVTNSTVTPAALTDLNFSLLASTDYTFQYLLSFTAAATTTGLGVSVTATGTPTTFTYMAQIAGLAADGAGASYVGAGTASADVVVSSAVVAATPTQYLARVDGVIRTGSATTLSVLVNSEVAASAVVVKRGSQGMIDPR